MNHYKTDKNQYKNIEPYRVLETIHFMYNTFYSLILITLYNKFLLFLSLLYYEKFCFVPFSKCVFMDFSCVEYDHNSDEDLMIIDYE